MVNKSGYEKKIMESANFFVYCKNLNYLLSIQKFNAMPVLKVIEVLASSEKGWEDATREAVKMAAKTVKAIRSVYVQDMSAVVKNDDVTEFRVTVRITFEVKS